MHFSMMVIGGDTERQLAPYHTFEATEREDEYVMELSVLDEARERYKRYKENWKDRPRAANLDFPRRPLQFLNWLLSEDYGPLLIEGEEDRAKTDEAYRFGWTLVTEDRFVIDVVKRTNPNAKWDYYRLGGRWEEFFPVKLSGKDRNTWSASKRSIDYTRDMDVPYGFIKDGVWYDRDQKTDQGQPVSKAAWDGIFWDMFDALPENMPLVIVDCHV